MSQFNQNDLATLMSQPVNREILFLDKSVLPEGEITIDAVLSLYRQSDKGMMGINQLVTLLVSAEQLNDLLQNNKPLASLVLRDDTDLASFHLDIDETMRTFMHTGHGGLKGFDSDHDPHCQNSCHPHPNNLNGGKGDNHGTIQCRAQTSHTKQTFIT